jgi:hypothetical protein
VHWAAIKLWDDTLDAKPAVVDRVRAADDKAENALVEIVPTTKAGAAALIDHVIDDLATREYDCCLRAPLPAIASRTPPRPYATEQVEPPQRRYIHGQSGGPRSLPR